MSSDIQLTLGDKEIAVSSIFPEVQHHQIGAAVLNDVAEELHDTAKNVPATHSSDSDGASVIFTTTTTSSMHYGDGLVARIRY